MLLLLLLASCCKCSLSAPRWSLSGINPNLFRRRRPLRSAGFFQNQVSPVSYRSQSLHYADDQDDDDDWYKDRSYRPWNVDFTSRPPGHYSLTSRIVMLNVAVYALQVFFPSITRKGIKLSDRILAGQDLYRLVTPMFLHGSIVHLMTNTYSLQAVGNDVERYFGGGRFLSTYLLSGVIANFVSAVKSPNPSLGASGAVFGVVGAYFVFLNRNMNFFGRQGENMVGAISKTIVMNVLFGAMSPNVDNWSHLGGVLGGAALSYYFGPKLYIGALPNGARTIVDKPILRLPRAIESIPERVDNRIRQMIRRMQVESYKSSLPEKPWRRKAPGRDYRRRQSGPIKSVRPRI